MDFATPSIFTNARTDPDEETDPTRGQRLDIRVYEARYNSQNVRVTLRVGRRPGYNPWEQTEQDQESALGLTRYYNRDRELEYTEMEVRSPYLRRALREVVKKYPGLAFDTGKVIIRDEPRCLFHFRNELREYGTQLVDETAAAHLVFLLNYMYNSLMREMTSFYTFMEPESPTAAPGIEFDFLWMAFKPEDLVFREVNGIHRIYRFKSMERHYRPPGWQLRCVSIAYDGDTFGSAITYISIAPYDGYKPLTELRAFPLQYHSSKVDIYQRSIARGHKYASMKEASHRYYYGVGDSLSPYRIQAHFGEEDEFTMQSIAIKGRIMVDCKKFGALRPTHKVHFSTTDVIRTNDVGMPMLAEDEWCIFESRIPGFSLSAKRWCLFEVDRISEFKYNRRAYESLALDSSQKSMLISLVMVHAEGIDFDDLVKGKGKGIICLLHGEPGTGKTLTAESLSDYTERPLYSVSSGDIGTTAADCEKSLAEILDLATHWKAVLLIDEADVFLEQRSTDHLARNGVVSVFLRLLEYFEGIMFLTTNRVTHFDAAFKSRIHLAIKYPALSQDSQRQLWNTFITNDGQRSMPLWLDDAFLDNLTSKMLDGRQIRNIARIAMALAAAEGTELQPEYILNSLQAIQDFDKDFTGDSTDAHNNDVVHPEQGEENLDARREVSGKGPKRRRM